MHLQGGHLFIVAVVVVDAPSTPPRIEWQGIIVLDLSVSPSGFFSK